MGNLSGLESLERYGKFIPFTRSYGITMGTLTYFASRQTLQRLPALMASALFCVASWSPSIAAQEESQNAAAEEVIQPSRARGFFIDRPVPLEEDSPRADFHTINLDFIDDSTTISLEEDVLDAYLQDYSQVIEELESSGNAWDQNLVQNLRVQGELYAEQGNLAMAAASFDKAIHINRINQGLHTPDQIVDLKRMLETNIQLGNWRAAEEQSKYLIFLLLKNFGSEDPRIVETLVDAAAWNTQLFTSRAGETIAFNIRTAQLFYIKAIQLIQNDPSRLQELVRYYQALAVTGYLVNSNPGAFDGIEENALRVFESNLTSRLGMPSSSRTDKALGLGKIALEQLISHLDSVRVQIPLETHVRAVVDLADWHLLAGNRYAAARNYTIAEELMAGSEDALALREQLFSGVTRIPSFLDSSNHAAAVLYNPELGTQMQSGFADVMFDIARDGSVRNLEFLTERTEENYRHLNRLRAGISRSIFRPHIEQGETVLTKDQIFRFRYWY